MQILFSLPGGSEWLLILLVIAGSVFWIKMILEIAGSDFRDSTTKLVWLLITILSGVLRALIYNFDGRSSRLYKNFQ